MGPLWSTTTCKRPRPGKLWGKAMRDPCPHNLARVSLNCPTKHCRMDCKTPMRQAWPTITKLSHLWMVAGPTKTNLPRLDHTATREVPFIRLPTTHLLHTLLTVRHLIRVCLHGQSVNPRTITVHLLRQDPLLCKHRNHFRWRA